MSKLKVLHIIKSLGRGGAETLLQETLKVHDKNLFEFHYIYFIPWKDQMVEGIKKEGGMVNRFSAKNNITIFLKILSVVRYIKKNDIHLVHCHLPWAGILGRAIFKYSKIKLVYTEHNVQERYHPITKFFNKLTFNWQSIAIAVSEEVANSIQQAIKPNIPIVIVNNGVNVNEFKRNEKKGIEIRNEYGIDADCIIIGTVAVFRFQKRIKEWITVFKKAHQSFPHIRGCIIGDGLLKAEILSHLKEEKMEKYIFFPGLQTNVIPWLSAVDVFMMTSEFEGLPIALLEAMSMNCAIVATNAGGVKEVIRNGIDGFIEGVYNWEKLEDPLAYLIQNPQEIINYGQRARKRVEERYSINNMTNQIEFIYQSLSINK